MSFEAEMIIPQMGTDDLGQEARASSTFVRYALSLRHRSENENRSAGPLELVKEELAYIPLGDAKKSLAFKHATDWRKSAITGRRWVPYYISTDAGRGVIKVHQDGGSSGKPGTLLASNLPRTALSAANAAESPTATLARREMQSWRLLQLEPSALREPDTFSAAPYLRNDGAHLAATLLRLARRPDAEDETQDDSSASRVYGSVANSLAGLIEDVREVFVDRDEKRELLTLYVRGRDGTAHAARSLSDGTLRFLALAVLSQDVESNGVLCLEEPENGIHPERIPAMIRLLRELATDPSSPVDGDNPLRQVIINTHSPGVVMEVPEDSLLMAESQEQQQGDKRFRSLVFRCLPGTWREPSTKSVPLGRLLAYLNPVSPPDEATAIISGTRRVADRQDVKQLSFDYDASAA